MSRSSLPVLGPDGAPPPPQEPSGLDRRQILRIGATTAASGLVLGGLAFVDRDLGNKPRAMVRIKDHTRERPAGANELAVARGPSPAANVERAVEALGGMSAFVRPGERVVVKPNAAWNRVPEQAATTHPDVVAAVVRMVHAAGASQIWVADVPVNNPERCFERSGIRGALSDAATLVVPSSSAFRHVEVAGQTLRVAEVLFPFVDADRVINVAVVKHHGLSGATMCLKNWYGVLGGHRARLHQDIHRSIVDLAMMMKPTLSILDATRILVANGPTGGNLADVRRMDTVFAGVDEVALDAFGATLLGLRGEDLAFLREAEKLGLGRIDYRSRKLVEVAG
ncbi:MAG: DUF362 domain-containing protein [Deltaproteobacteria bacterium]|nr:DUF362 domain-containing protein [Deltaproteobacteria bacterium]